MNCAAVRERLSAYVDRDLGPRVLGDLAHHLEGCPPCAAEEAALRAAVDMLAALPRESAAPEIALAVLHRLEVERRGPALRSLFRPAWKARPLILPSLFPAALLFLLAIGGGLWVDHRFARPVPAVASGSARPARTGPFGSESNPALPTTGILVPQPLPGGGAPTALPASGGDDAVLFEAVVARDGRVWSVVPLGAGDFTAYSLLLEQLRAERFAPGRAAGRPVAVAIYRLFSRIEVRAGVT
jgi:anti-sigma factor RsiW